MTFHRRTVLKGMLGGAAVTVGLPALEAFAAESGFPKRLGVWFWGNGMHPDRFVPEATGEGYVLPEQLASLAPHQADFSIVSGLAVQTGNTIPHWSGVSGILCGAPLAVESGDDYTFQAPTLDQVAARKIGNDTRFRSLELGVRPDRGVSFNGANSRNPPLATPRAAFDRIFGGGFVAPGGEAVVDPKLRLRRSVLDSVLAGISSLKSKVSATDRRRLEQHFDGVRALEQRIARLEQDPPDLEACSLPTAPNDDYPYVDGRPPLPEISAIMSEIMAMTLACDQARAFSFTYSYPLNNLLWPGMPAGHHRLTHDEPGDQPNVNTIMKQIIAELAVFIGHLKAIPEGDGTLLDNCAVLCTSDTSFARNHSITDYPAIIAGKAGGALKTGVHYRSPSGENASMVGLTMLRAVGINAARFGSEAGEVDSALEDILA